MLKQIAKSSISETIKLVIFILVFAAVLVNFSLRIYGDGDSSPAALFILAASIAIYLTSLLWFSRYAHSINHVTVIPHFLKNPVWYKLLRTGLISFLAVACVTYSGQLKMTMLISGNQVVQIMSLFNTRLYEWKSENTSSFIHQSQNTFLVNLNTPLLFIDMHDSRTLSHFSDMEIFEDGRQLMKPHALHGDIETLGLGHYSHWGKFLARKNSVVYLSSLDNISPITSGRTFEFRYRLLLHPIIIVFLFAFGGILLSRTPHFPKIFLVTENPFKARLTQNILLTFFFLFVTFTFLYPLYMSWSKSLTFYQLIGGYIPWSDASGWKFSAAKLLHTGELYDWSQRRPINPAVRQ